MIYHVLSVLATTILTGPGAIAVSKPRNQVPRHTTHRTRTIGRLNTKFTTYHPPATFEVAAVATYGTGIDHPLSKRGIVNATSSDVARSFLETALGVASYEISRKSGHESERVSHEYFHQVINGLPVANAVANVAIENNKILSFGSSFVKPANIASKHPGLTEEDAITIAENATGGTYNEWPTSLEYFISDHGHAALVYIVQVQKAETSEWYEIFVDASNGSIVNIIDFVAHTGYRAVPFGLQNPTQGYSLIVNPEDLVASPNGWRSAGSTGLLGNNAMYTTQSTMQSSADTFDYPYDPSLAPSQGNNPKASQVNAFYTVNMCHDFTYRYGFTESAFNFQQNNNGKGGAGNDRVIISIQDGAGTGDSFATPPDGQSPVMRLNIWTYATGGRDQALESDLIAHEYGHGVSNRLTGGGTARCLQTTEAAGMGEGWSDTLAEMTGLASATVPDFTLGSWLANKPEGIRSYPYSTNMQTNPLTYGNLATRTEVHDIGEVWATMWHEIIAALVSKYGVSLDRNNASGAAGNIVAMHLYIDTLKLQPCNPTFVTARNATIQADLNRYGGINRCLLWKAFAKRGLGNGATATKANNMDLPADCV
ncbi:extracellular metalloproteinase MEP [Ceratobasidium sp. AG-Ba]|nr:extracellular metalloproteinase MEP [Ceratobasidium sp. AG-Ba]